MAVYPNIVNSLSLSVTQAEVQELSDAVVTTGDVTYYVDNTTGSDSNDGSMAFPFATLDKAISMIPDVINDFVTIYLVASVNPYVIPSNGLNISKTILESGRIQIIGAMANYTPSTGDTTGTFDSSSGIDYADENYWALSTGAWTADELIGKFVKMTNTITLFDEWLPINRNTATNIYALGNSSGKSSTSTFALQEPSVFITFEGQLNIRCLASKDEQSLYMDRVSTPTIEEDNSIKSGMIHFQHINFNFPDAELSIIVSPGCAVSFTECTFSQEVVDYFQFLKSSGLIFMKRCVVSNDRGIQMSNDASLYAWYVGFTPIDSSTGLVSAGDWAIWVMSGTAKMVFAGCYWANYNYGDAYTAVIKIDQGVKANISMWYGAPKIYNCDMGFWINGDLKLSNQYTGATPTKFTIDHATYGILVDEYGHLNMDMGNIYGGGESLNMTNTVDTGIYIASPHNNIILGANTVFTGYIGDGNTPWWGINFVAQGSPTLKSFSRFNVVTWTDLTGCSITNFTAKGQMTLDGTTETTLAALDSDPDKTIMDAVRLNILTIQ